MGKLDGRSVLDVGCGEGSDTVMLAKLGAARVVGVDISPKAIELGRERALLDGVADRVDFICAPIETADILADSFDVVWCNAILHHLTDNLHIVLRKLALWAKADGLISFAEPINFNNTLRALRKVIPVSSGGATPDERPLEPTDVDIIRQYVEPLRTRHFGLIGRLDQFVLTEFNYERSSPVRRSVVNATAVVDYLLLSLPGIDQLGSISVMWGRPVKVDRKVIEMPTPPAIRAAG